MTIETMSKRQLQGAAFAAPDRMHDVIHRENHVTQGRRAKGRRAKGGYYEGV